MLGILIGPWKIFRSSVNIYSANRSAEIIFFFFFWRLSIFYKWGLIRFPRLNQLTIPSLQLIEVAMKQIDVTLSSRIFVLDHNLIWNSLVRPSYLTWTFSGHHARISDPIMALSSRTYVTDDSMFSSFGIGLFFFGIGHFFFWDRTLLFVRPRWQRIRLSKETTYQSWFLRLTRPMKRGLKEPPGWILPTIDKWPIKVSLSLGPCIHSCCIVSGTIVSMANVQRFKIKYLEFSIVVLAFCKFVTMFPFKARRGNIFHLFLYPGPSELYIQQLATTSICDHALYPWNGWYWDCHLLP